MVATNKSICFPWFMWCQKHFLSELAEGVDSRSARPSKVSGAATRTKSNRRPTTLAGARKALSYVLGDLNRILVPAHHNYQVRLKDFLAGRGIVAEWERDFVDVRFQLEGHTFIGEVKVTTYLSLDEAFRTALGQLLFYGHVGFEKPPELTNAVGPEARREAPQVGIEARCVGGGRIRRGQVQTSQS